jgi:nucleotide-binding universal stress UspA family protein
VYKKILVPVDGSSTSQRGLAEAIRIAKHCNATLRVLHIVNELVMAPGYPSVTGYTDVIDALRESGKKVLRTSEEQVRREGVACETQLVEVLGTTAANSIVDDARRWGADLIVMGTHGRRGIRRLALGSDAEIVLRHSPVPILLVRDAPEQA